RWPKVSTNVAAAILLSAAASAAVARRTTGAGEDDGWFIAVGYPNPIALLASLRREVRRSERLFAPDGRSKRCSRRRCGRGRGWRVRGERNRCSTPRRVA